VGSKAKPTWPAVGGELHRWESDAGSNASRRQALRQRGSYKAAVVPMIASEQLSLSASDLAVADEAASEISRFDSELGQMIAPFASILLRSEAASSSQIENLTSSPAAIVRAELGLKDSANSSLIVSNQNAMRAAVRASSKLSSGTILKMHRVLTETTDSKNAGVFRTQPVWIGGTPFGPHGADYVGPDSLKVPGLVDDLVLFCNRVDLPALVQIAIAHAQFETIHPFTDGNGRTGRALVQVLLHRLGLTKSVMVPVSAGLLRSTKQYFDALNAYRSGDPLPIIQVFAEGSLFAVQNGRKLAGELQAVRINWDSMLRARTDSGARKLLDQLLAQPLITRTRAMEVLGRSAANTQLAIDKLVETGILIQAGSGSRNRVWQAPDVLSALDDFASRTKR
jgi:Fic family protein